MAKPEVLKIRPYARLLTMLGEQLIKNERIALIELIKNSYDADAKWVVISFENFGDNFEIHENSKIIIEDCGLGMSDKVIKDHWLNPATPEKKNRKKIKDTTPSGRIIQGEKGIGRFAILKLGKVIDIYTRAKGSETEAHLEYDFSDYDNDFLVHNGEETTPYIDELEIKFRSSIPSIIDNKQIDLGIRKIRQKKFGTRIEITDLKGTWSSKKVEKIYRDFGHLQSLFEKKDDGKKKSDVFDIHMLLNGKLQTFKESYIADLQRLLDESSVLRIQSGSFDKSTNQFTFELNGAQHSLSLFSPEITGLNVFNQHFGDRGKELEKRNVECGSFEFEFFIFDFSSDAKGANALDRSEKETLRDHRIYLYRDGIRVFPYGEPDDDWLKIDIYRGTISAGHFLSNDQVVGHVDITQRDNPRLQDKTNREGLIEDGYATEDFICLLQTLLRWVRVKPYARYRENLKNRKKHQLLTTSDFEELYQELKSILSKDQKALKVLEKTQKLHKAERSYLLQRAETTEELAGVGLSVETASHDVMAILSRVATNLDGLIKELAKGGKIQWEHVLTELQSIRGGVSFVEAQLKDIQLLFTSSKQRRRNIRVREIIEKVEKIYSRLLDKEGISISIEAVGSPLVAKTTDAVLLQLLLNLFDNSVYWLQQQKSDDRRIEITLNGSDGELVFSDSGPGILKEDVPYIFEPFFSGKGQDGRGLGLYIARQLLERHGYSIELASSKIDRKLPGANFVISFIEQED